MTGSVNTKFPISFWKTPLLSYKLKTRRVSNSVWYLVATTYPHLVSNVRVVPGISNHGVVCYLMLTWNPNTKLNCLTRSTNFYKKGNIDQLRSETRTVKQPIRGEWSPLLLNSLNTNWQMIRDNIQFVGWTYPVKTEKGLDICHG